MLMVFGYRMKKKIPFNRRMVTKLCCSNVPSTMIDGADFSFYDIQRNLDMALSKSKASKNLLIEALLQYNNVPLLLSSTDTFFDDVVSNLQPAPSGYRNRLTYIGADGSVLRERMYPCLIRPLTSRLPYL